MSFLHLGIRSLAEGIDDGVALLARQHSADFREFVPATRWSFMPQVAPFKSSTPGIVGCGGAKVGLSGTLPLSHSARRGSSDEKLLARVGLGDKDALSEIYDRHSATAFGLALRMCRDRSDAEDAVQETFLSVLRASASFDPSRGSVRNWLLGILRHRVIDVCRRNATAERTLVAQTREAEHVPRHESSPSDVAQERERSREIRAKLARLPDDQREVIERAFFGGLTHTEICSTGDVALGTVKSRMRLGLQKLAGASELAA